MVLDFEEIFNYALRSQLVYAITQPAWYITEKLGWRTPSPYRIFIEEATHSEVNTIIELDDEQRVQWVAVRGSDNLSNWLANFKYVEQPFTKHFAQQDLAIDLHCGFRQAAVEVFQAIKTHLERDYQTRITGHSLGGAIAVILMMFLKDEGYSIEKCITFGQPKVTNHVGVQQCQHLPLLRVINQEDSVPLVPPCTALNLLQGGYSHFGSEIQLEPDSYIYREAHTNCDLPSDSFWSRLFRIGVEEDIRQLSGNIENHYMKFYLLNLISNLHSGDGDLKSLLQGHSVGIQAVADLKR